MRVAPEFGEVKEYFVDEDGVAVNPDVVEAAREEGVKSPTILGYFLREHLVLAVLFPYPLYSHQPQVLSRKGRIFMLAVVFLIAFLGATVYSMFTKDLVSCSAAAYCLANCRRDFAASGRSDACAITPFSAQYAGDRGYKLFAYPPIADADRPPASDPAAFVWCGSGELDPPVCVPYCISSGAIGDDDRPSCASVSGSADASWLLCVAPTSIAKCRKSGSPSDPSQTSFAALAGEMDDDDTETTNTAGRVIIYLVVALAVFFITTLVKKLVSCVTRPGRPWYTAFVVKIVGGVIIVIFVVLIVVLALNAHAAESSGSGSSFGDSMLLFSTSFFGSLALDFVKLTVFYYIFPRHKAKWRAAFADELALIAGAYSLRYDADV